MLVSTRSSPLRKVAAFRDLPSLVSPYRFSNPPSYPHSQPLPGARAPDELAFLLASPSKTSETLTPDVKDSIHGWLSTFSESDDPEMFHFSEKHGSVPLTPGGSPGSSWAPTVRRKSWFLTPRKIALVAGGCLVFVMLNFLMSQFSNPGV